MENLNEGKKKAAAYMAELAEIDKQSAIVAMEDGNFQLFSSDPTEHVDDLYQLRQQYKNLYGV